MKESSNQGGIPDETIIRAPDILSNNPEERASQCNDFFDTCHGVLTSRKLQHEELGGISLILSHVMEEFHLDYADPLVKNGFDVIHSHFARVFGTESTASFESILQKVHDSRYFEGRDIDDGELDAFVLLEDRFADQLEK